MSSASPSAASPAKSPWHLWAVAILTLLWNGSGAYTIVLAQAGRLADIGSDEAAYYAAQPLWFVLVTDISLFAPLVAALALLFRSQYAVWFFALSLTTILLTNLYDLAAGTSRMLVSNGAMVLTGIILAIAVLQLFYAWAMKKRAVLK